ncbi:MAG TPA: formate dehydrogenase subunit gamma [Candidatus Acidoferrum sp.]|jgi:formate dehydrogenase subunit gamma
MNTRADAHADEILANGRIMRYSFRERLMHWINGFAYLYLMLTGLAFWSPWLLWIAVILGGAQISRMLHPWIGLVFAVSLTWMYLAWASQMHTTEADKAWWNSMNHYVRNEDEEMPPAGRYNMGQKLLFWGFILCGVLLFLSGLVLWIPEHLPWNARALRYAAVLIHPAAAMITIGLFMIHIYMSVFAERGAFNSMTRGDVSEGFAKRYHRLWWERVVGSVSRR